MFADQAIHNTDLLAEHGILLSQTSLLLQPSLFGK